MMSQGDLFVAVGPRTPAAVWLDAGQGALAAGIARHAGLSYVAAGGPEGKAGAAIGGVGAERRLADLRSAIADSGAGLWVRCVVVLSRVGVGSDDLAALASAHGRRVVVCGIEPAPSRLDELTSGQWLGRPGAARAIDRYQRLARLRTGAPMGQARDMLAAFGAVRSAWVRCEGSASEGSLGARLVDGLDVLHDVMGEPEGVIAAASGLDPAGDGDLSLLRGEMCVTLMYGDGRTASVLATDGAAEWRREVELFGEAGVVRLEEDGFVWRGVDGAVRDEWARLGGSGGAERMGESIARLLDPHAGVEAAFDAEGVLATAHAALLSARTRSVEMVGAIRRMMEG